MRVLVVGSVGTCTMAVLIAGRSGSDRQFQKWFPEPTYNAGSHIRNKQTIRYILLCKLPINTPCILYLLLEDTSLYMWQVL